MDPFPSMGGQEFLRARSLCTEYHRSSPSSYQTHHAHGQQLELKEVVLDREATEVSRPDHCWVCEE